MNERFGILHLSDIHASEKSKVTIQRLVGLLKTDIQTMQERHNVSIKMICISGDLINSGDDADALRLSPDRYARQLPDLPHDEAELADRANHYRVRPDLRLLPDDPVGFHGNVHRLQCVYGQPLERNRHHALLFARQL